ncbi:MAG TPA: fasciclin domain-containing protein [Arenimonas sp.]|nr:fasciclin domain-containing protein [Arenimonas sp.]
MSNTSQIKTAPSGTPADGEKNLVETAAANSAFKTFSKAVRQAGMTEALSAAGPFTVLAPTDAAFDKLPAGRLDNLLKPENKAELVSILNYHILTGRSDTDALGKLTSTRTKGGDTAPIVLKDNKLSIDGAQLTMRDIASSNGVLHGIDKVNLPAKH